MSFINKLVRENREVSLFLLDSFIVIISYILGFFIRFIDPTENLFLYAEYFKVLICTIPFILIINYFFFYIFKINNSLWKYTSIDEAARICFASACSNILWLIIVFVKPVIPYIRSVPILAMMFQIFIMLGLRMGYRLYRKKYFEKKKHKNALIIGAGSAGTLLYRDILINDKFDYRIIGFIDDNEKLKGKIISGVPILGTVSELPDIIDKMRIDIVFIAIPSASRKRTSEIIHLCSNLNLKTNIMNYTVMDDFQEKSNLREVSIDDLLGRDETVLDIDSISDYINNSTIMVTGAGGSIGSELCRQILKYRPKMLILFDIYENNMYSLQQEIIISMRNNEYDKNIEIICLIGSVRDQQRLDEVMEKYDIDVVFHAAAHKHVPLVEDSPKEAIKNNIFGTLNVLNTCIKNKVKKFILISTDKAVNPTNVMGATKRVTELIVQALRDNGITQVGAVRFGNVLGSNGSVIPLFKKQIENGGPVTVTDPNIERYFMTIPEAASLVLQAGAYANKGDIFVLDMGTRVKILKLAEDMISLSGLKPYEDIKIEFIGLRPGEKMYEELSLGNEKRYKTANEKVFVTEPMSFDGNELLHEINELNESLGHLSDKKIEIMLFNIIEKYK